MLGKYTKESQISLPSLHRSFGWQPNHLFHRRCDRGCSFQSCDLRFRVDKAKFFVCGAARWQNQQLKATESSQFRCESTYMEEEKKRAFWGQTRTNLGWWISTQAWWKWMVWHSMTAWLTMTFYVQEESQPIKFYYASTSPVFLASHIAIHHLHVLSLKSQKSAPPRHASMYLSYFSIFCCFSFFLFKRCSWCSWHGVLRGKHPSAQVCQRDLPAQWHVTPLKPLSHVLMSSSCSVGIMWGLM